MLLMYLGLLGLEALPTSAWKEAWLTGTEITNALIAGVNDTTLAFKALDILESLADQDMLYRISTKIQHALGNRGQQLIHQRIAYWFLDSLDVHSDINTHYIHVKINTEPFTLLEQGVLDLVAILKRTTSTPFAVCLVQLACEIVGEYSYLLDSVTDITVMECLYKWIEAIQGNLYFLFSWHK
ncbi:hypothetical protein BDF14DRAFT_1346534 [Spinellus fusiger]|nr:hypothetical protein BDF14DRAFT_1346534 [Spinellus fusiger]